MAVTEMLSLEVKTDKMAVAVAVLVALVLLLLMVRLVLVVRELLIQ
jgi:hypothetical protein